jgi:hypothetical protein
MPLSFGIPVGLLLFLIGLVLYFATSQKQLAKLIVGIGLAITLLTAVLIALVLISPM